MSHFRNLSVFPQLSFVELPAYDLAGLRVRTDMGKAYQDCPALWMRFMPRLQELAAQLGGVLPLDSFGASTLVDMDNDIFDYWAVMPYPTDAPLPEGMERLSLVPALYAACSIPSLAQLNEVYSLIYSKWLPSQSEYVFNCAPCLEHYDERYSQSGALDVLVPVFKA